MRAYQQAQSAWLLDTARQDQPGGLANAYRGIGFAARHLGDRRYEEDAYISLMRVCDDAESHFLFGQCYREHQKSQLALKHFQRAVELDSAYHERVNRIRQSMMSEHFGCFRLSKI